MLADLNLEQQDNVNMQIRLLQVKHEFEEVCWVLHCIIDVFIRLNVRNYVMQKIDTRMKSKI